MKNWKKAAALGLAALMTLAPAAAVSAEEAELETEPETELESEADVKYSTIKDGVLMVGTEIGYPPMEYFDEDGATPIGFDIELAQALADDMGLELELVDTAWDGIFAGVETEKYDVILSCVSWTEGRNENYTLSKTYVANAPVLVVPNDSEIADITDLSGKSVAVQMETTADYLIQDYIADGLDTDLRQYEKVINAFDELKIGRVDAVCTDAVVASFYLGDEVNNYKNVWEAEEKEPICMCLKKGNDALCAALEASLDNLKEEGTLGEIATKYFGYDITADEEKEMPEFTTIKEGVLQVAAEIGYPPMEYFDEDGATPIGFDMEMSRLLADKLGLELEIVDTAWDGIFAGVDTDKYDVVISCVSWLESRDEMYCLSKPYVANAPVLVVPNDSGIADVADLDGKTVAVQMETTADYLMQEKASEGIGMDIRQYEKIINAFDELKFGRVDSVCTDSVVAAFYLGDEASNYKEVWQADEAEPIVMCAKKGNDSLIEALEIALDELKEDGSLSELAVKYFGSDNCIDLD